MAHTIELMKEEGYVRVVFSGEVTLDALTECRDEVKRVMADNRCRRLLGEGESALLRQSLAEEYEFTSEHRAHLPLVAEADAAEYFRFVENVAQNRGVNQKVFLDRADALEWLLVKPDADV